MTSTIRPSSVFLVSGGAKGITRECVIRIAQRHQCKFILLGRSAIVESEPDWAKDCFEESGLKKHIMEHLLSQGEKPTPMCVQKVFKKISSSREINNTLSRIKQAGGRAEYVSVDVTDALAVKEKVAPAVKRLGSITGVIHGAGNLADKLIEKKTEQDFETVYAAKVKGLENTLSYVDLNYLEYLVLFSSTAGFYGNIGQTDYAIANEILNKSAHLVKQKYPDCHVVAINWGPWESGMVSPELKKAFQERNIGIIPMEVGAQMLVNELDAANHTTAQVVVASPATPPARELDSKLRTYRIHRQLKLEDNPFFMDHVIAGYPVLPATCAMSWIINTCENLYPGYRLFSCTNFKVLKGIIFNEDLADEYILDLQEDSKNNDFNEITFSAKIWHKNLAKKNQYNFSGEFKLLREISPAPTYDFAKTPDGNKINENREVLIPNWEDNNFYQNGVGMLFHGLSFQGVKRFLTFGKERFTAECCWQGIEAKQQGQFPVQWFNPYAVDLSTHPLGIWLQHFYQESALPAQLDKYEQFARIPCNKDFYVSGKIKSKTDINLIVDFVIHDLEGKVFVRLFGSKFVRWFY
ncbi:SDR family NAD(P)-dependent oxidoreductase [Nostoc sp. FACHB-892]|uniref:SDR family NAD(P)-dependent oxidoreductase n=1 Tax=Nostoc sp. FACHB-892 TaxID=2692843 RepID=UPI0016870E82|nr:SDR family NAD(P)-dependent oxidoreductase [Nostoc sp. FACHB-892]MBD2729716.1 SDR family NAD(P)-dependent oxidoreductase [Nostoc sp. FACHB-892]